VAGAQTDADRVAAQARLDRVRTERDRLAPLDPATENRLPLAVDLSSRRVRGARRVLAAVRAGQPLAAVLGYQFERDLADAGLQRFLAAFRKLTRFHTGTALEQVEQARRDRLAELAAARRGLAQRQQAAADLEPPLRDAQAAEAAATERAARADAAVRPIQAMRTERDSLNGRIGDLTTQLANLGPRPPRPPHRSFQLNVP
jgi:hypothetical protein